MATASPPGQGGKQILGMDPLLFWGLVGAAGLGAAYFLLHKPAANPPGAAGTGGPGLISADGAPILYPLGSGQAGSGAVGTQPSGGGTTGPGVGGPKHGPPPRRMPPVRHRGVRPRPKGLNAVLTAFTAQPVGSAHAGSGVTAPPPLPVGGMPVTAGGASFPGVSSGGFVWPFPTKSPSQFRRVDQGWDLQYAGTRPTPVLAVAPGRVVQLGPDPSGFGEAYPGLILSRPRSGVGEVYYGHTFLNPGIVGKHVRAGQVIGHTGGPSSGGDAAGTPNWLEIGVIGPGGSFPPMGAGSRMRQLLLHAPTAASLRRGRTVQAAPTHHVTLPGGTPGPMRMPRLPRRPSRPRPPRGLPLLPPPRRAAPKPRPRPRRVPSGKIRAINRRF